MVGWYCWWLKSCTTWDVWNPINNGINYQPQLVSRISAINRMLVSCNISPSLSSREFQIGPRNLVVRSEPIHPWRCCGHYRESDGTVAKRWTCNFGMLWNNAVCLGQQHVFFLINFFFWDGSSKCGVFHSRWVVFGSKRCVCVFLLNHKSQSDFVTWSQG